MNGRLYDPLLRRFLNADENIQDMFNTQNYNKYGYVLNNPLMYNDPSGEFIGIVFGAIKIISAVLSAIQIVKSVDALVTGRMDVFQFAKGLFFMVVSKVVSAGVGEIFKAGGDVVKALGDYAFIAQAGVHAASQSLLSTMQGGNFGNTFWKSLGTNLALHGLGMISASKNSSKNGTEGGNITQSDSKNAEIIPASEDRVSGETRLEELVVSKQKGYWGSKIYAHVNNSISDLNVYQSRMRLANAIYNSNVAQSIGNFEQFLFSEIPGWFLGGVPIGRVGGIAVGGAKLASKTSTTAFKSFTKSNYRHNLQVLTGKSGAGMDAHHIFPQSSRFQQHWDRVGLNIHDPKNLTWWQSGAHRSAAGAYNKAWDLFFEKNPQATLQQIQNFGNSLMKSHGF